ncbi:E3 ubiquitin-protein ligase RGLG1-like [Pyrus ussuriensis x Pyrus communis]|uniref:E3 ubiquitin-protein ligase RGLG1-like n=1 Tax=Pyrus ussuriensis x Pyrus communis TaxID=2448454 RepID=A0A5N5HV23_9ROSA|nr:E3 ubiquitin-protein ligase RGLG1-like [Pyrus ussuriensis x Pyrus communis]
MGGFGCVPTMLRRPKKSRSRPYSKSVYPQARSQDSEETQCYDSKLYSTTAENNNSLKAVTRPLAHVGFDSSKLIVGMDFTKFSDWAGEKSFNRRSLHHIGDSPNPFEQAISTVGKTCALFDNIIPCFGFGDATTYDNGVFSICPDGRHCDGFEEILTAYKKSVPSRRLAGPTSFAPIIEKATSIVEKSGGQFHVLLIITSGQLGVQKQNTFDAIVEASKFPLSIILVGVGDGPWDIVKKLGDSTPSRLFDNLQFANFTDIMTKNVPPSKKEAEFARAVLMKVPSQYKATRNFSMLGGQTGNFSQRVSLCPPHYRERSFVTTAPTVVRSTDENEVCTICFANSVNMVLFCGHQICGECKPQIYHCPWCRIQVGTEDYKLI